MAAMTVVAVLFPVLFGLGGTALFLYVLYRVIRKAVRDALWDVQGGPRQQ